MVQALAAGEAKPAARASADAFALACDRLPFVAEDHPLTEEIALAERLVGAFAGR